MNTIVILSVISFVLSLDYSIALITLQAYWSHLNGPDNLFGVVFGMYDAFVIVITPLFAWLLNKNYISYKLTFLIGLFLNMVGNILYALADISDKWVVLFIGRIVAGVGASVVPLCVVYIALFMDSSLQKSAVGYIKYTCAITRVLGPVIGTGLSFIKLNNKLFNEYTTAGWIPSILCVLALILTLFWNENKEEQNILIVNEEISIWDIFKQFIPIWCIGFATTFIYWYFMANGFVIGVYRFHIINNIHDLGKIYYAGLGAFVLAFIIFLIAKEKISGILGLTISSVITTISMCIFLFDINYLFYIAVGISTFFYAILVPSINIQNNSIARNNKNKLGSYSALSIVALIIFQSIARFTGPACFMLSKSLSVGPQCNVTDSEKYIIDECSIDGYFVSSTSFIAGSFVLTIICAIFCVFNFKSSEPS